MKTPTDVRPRARRGFVRRVALASATVLAISVGILGAPMIATAEDCPPASTQQPLPTPTPTPAPGADPAPAPGAEAAPGALATDEETLADPGDDPAGCPTEEPTPTPTPTPTDPSPTPTPTSTPTPEPTGTPEPTAGATPTPTAASTTRPQQPDDAAVQIPVRRSTISANSTAKSAALSALARQRAASMLTAKTSVTAAQAAYTKAEKSYEAAQASVHSAEAIADRLETLAAAADASAETAARALLQRAKAAGGHGAPTTLDVLFDRGSGGGDLLRALGTLSRLEHSGADPSALDKQMRADTARADRLREKSQDAAAAASAIPLADMKLALASADSAVGTATAALATVQLAAVTSAASAGSTTLPDVAGAPDRGQLSEAGWTSPVTGHITDGYGPRPEQPAGAGPFHYGVDIAAACATWISAASAGTVVDAGWFGSLGNWVLIDHGSGVETAYAHIATGGTVVSVGEHVDGGQPIGLVGSTGASTGCHLHVEVRLDGVRTDPQPFFAARGVVLGG